MRSDTSTQRLACPHCHANNFLGQDRCWQCKGSLPPPEMVARPTPASASAWGGAAPIAPLPGPTVNGRSGGSAKSSLVPLMIAVVLLTASGAIWFAMHQAPSLPGGNSGGVPGTSVSNSFPGEGAGMRELRQDARNEVPERDMPSSGLAGPGSSPVPDMGSNGDPNVAAAKQAVQRALPRLGLPAGGNQSSDGTVHLRNGDTISREQYEETQRKLKNNPLFGSGAPVPRL